MELFLANQKMIFDESTQCASFDSKKHFTTRQCMGEVVELPLASYMANWMTIKDVLTINFEVLERFKLKK